MCYDTVKVFFLRLSLNKVDKQIVNSNNVDKGSDNSLSHINVMDKCKDLRDGQHG